MSAAWIFDLDDTLYKERDYVRSCFNHVGGLLNCAHVSEELGRAFDSGAEDPIGAMCRRRGLSEARRRGLIESMRSHAPAITLSPDAAELLTGLRERSTPFSILTNGRSVTQRRKIEALGLVDAKYIFISEEIGVAKPDIGVFKAAQDVHAADRYIYVGDNIAKDFAGPNALGWLSVMLIDDGRNIHPQDIDVPADARPKKTVSSLTELIPLV